MGSRPRPLAALAAAAGLLLATPAAARSVAPAPSGMRTVDVRQATFSFAPDVAPVRFRDGAGAWSRRAASDDDGLRATRGAVTQAAVVYGDLVAQVPGDEAVVIVQPEEGFYGGNDFGATVVVLGLVDGKVETLASLDFTKYGTRAFAEQVAVEGRDLVVRGDAYGADDAGCCPCHTHVSRYRFERTTPLCTSLREVSRKLARATGEPCGP